MICPKCEKENRNEYATVCAYCGQNLYHNADMDEKAKELAKKYNQKYKAVNFSSFIR